MALFRKTTQERLGFLMVELTATNKASGNYRALEIVLGIIALAVGVLVLVFPSIVIITLIVFFALALFAVGILRLATAASSAFPPSIRGVNAAIGIIAILVAIVMAFVPALAAAFLVVLLGIALLIYGIGRIVVGGTATNLNMGLRAALVVLGLIVAVFAVIVIVFPSVGVYTYAFFAAIAFLAIGLDSLISGIAGIPLV